LFSFSGHQIKREKNNQDKKDPDCPEQAAPNGIPVFLGIEKNPKGNHHTNDGNEKSQKISLFGSSPRLSLIILREEEAEDLTGRNFYPMNPRSRIAYFFN